MIEEYGGNPFLQKFVYSLSRLYRTDEDKLHFLTIEEFDDNVPLARNAEEQFNVPKSKDHAHNYLKNHLTNHFAT